MAQAVAKRKFGGKQEGAGRPKGVVTQRLRTIRDLSMKAMKSAKRVPLETMLKNMNRFDEEADVLYAELLELRQQRPATRETKQLLAYFDKLTTKWSAMRECTLDAQKFAVDAAPFMHQRLAAVAVTVEDKTITRISEETSMSDDELSDYYNNLRLRPTSVKPLEIVTLDNETGQQINEEEN